MLCEKCGKEIPKTAVFCPNCGTKVLEKKKSKKKWLIPLCIVLSVAIVGGGVFVATKVVKKKYQRFREVDGKIEVYLPVKAKYFEIEEGEEKPSAEIKATYNSKGLLEICEDKSIDSDGEDIDKDVTQYSYSDTNKLISKKYIRDGASKTTEYTYDENDNLINMNYTDSDGHTTYREYDANNGNEIYYEHWGTEGLRDKGEILYEYNESGLKTKVMAEDCTTYFTYNDANQVATKKKISNKDGEVHDTVYEYDEKGNIVSCNGDPFTYDEKGRLVAVESNNSDDHIYEFSSGLTTYEYNKEGLIKQRKSHYTMSISYDEFGNMIEISWNTEEGINDGKVEIEYKPYYIKKEDWKDYHKKQYFVNYLCMLGDNFAEVLWINDGSIQELLNDMASESGFYAPYY